MIFQGTLNPYLALIHSCLHSSNSSVQDIVLQIYMFVHSDTPKCRTPLHTSLVRLFVCHFICVDMYEYVYMWTYTCIHYIPLWQDLATCVDHKVSHYSLSPWELYNVHFKFLAINTQLFCTPTWYCWFTPYCSKYILPKIQRTWQFKCNWSGGLILLSCLSRSRLAIPNLTASPTLPESCKFRHLPWLPIPYHANNYRPTWLWGTVVCLSQLSAQPRRQSHDHHSTCPHLTVWAAHVDLHRGKWEGMSST
jgi:hypothetical protein